MPPSQGVQDEQNMIYAHNEGSHNVYDAGQCVLQISSNGKQGRRRNVTFGHTNIGGKRRTRKQKRSGNKDKKSKTTKKRSGNKSKTHKKRGSRKRA